MWSKLSSELLGKETQDALTDALQKGKQAWQSIEQSLDQAVDADTVVSKESTLPISIPYISTPEALDSPCADAVAKADPCLEEQIEYEGTTQNLSPQSCVTTCNLALAADNATEIGHVGIGNTLTAYDSPKSIDLALKSSRALANSMELKVKGERDDRGKDNISPAPIVATPTGDCDAEGDLEGSTHSGSCQAEKEARGLRLDTSTESNGAVESSCPEPNRSQSTTAPAGNGDRDIQSTASSPLELTLTPAISNFTSIATAVPADGFQREREHLQRELRESQGRVQALENEIRKAQAIYMSEEAKQRQIHALQEEGKALAFKQSEMEQLVRKSRAELKKVESERSQLQESNEAHKREMVTLREQLRASETEKNLLAQSLSAVQAVNKSAAEKTSKLEQELSHAQVEISSQHESLQKAWEEEKEMKRMISEMTASESGVKDLQDPGKALSRGLAGIKDDFERREAVLQATNKQLQEALTRASLEAGLREDSLRQELAEMRRRWQDAVSRTEGMASDVHEATVPLLRQIKALQEEARGRAAAWASAEEALTDRARGAEGLARTAEAERLELGGRVEGLRTRIEDLDVQLRATTLKLHETAAHLKTVEAREAESRNRTLEVEQELKAAEDRLSHASKEKKSQETMLKRKLQEGKDALLVMKSEFEHEEARLKLEVETLENKLAAQMAAQERTQALHQSALEKGSLSNSRPHASSHARLSQNSILELTLSGYMSSDESTNSVADRLKGSVGSQYILASEKMHQALRQKETEIQHLQSRLHDLERTRDALTEEVTVLGRQNSLQAAKAMRSAAEVAKLRGLSKEKEVLLELLGEKTEEVEALEAETESLKARFRCQLDQPPHSSQGQKEKDQQPSDAFLTKKRNVFVASK